MSLKLNMTEVTAMLKRMALEALDRAGPVIVERLRENTSLEGSVVPWVVSAPGEPPADFNGSMVDGFGWITSETETGAMIQVYSNVMVPVDQMGTMKNVALEEELGGMEMGHYWGSDEHGAFALDWMGDNRWHWVGPAHYMAPRPYMAPMLPDLVAMCTANLGA